MEKKDQQYLIAEILQDLGLDNEVISTITSLTINEIKNK